MKETPNAAILCSSWGDVNIISSQLLSFSASQLLSFSASQLLSFSASQLLSRIPVASTSAPARRRCHRARGGRIRSEVAFVFATMRSYARRFDEGLDGFSVSQPLQCNKPATVNKMLSALRGARRARRVRRRPRRLLDHRLRQAKQTTHPAGGRGPLFGPRSEPDPQLRTIPLCARVTVRHHPSALRHHPS